MVGLSLGLGLGLSRGVLRDVTAPTITSTNTATVAENATLSKSLTASEAVTWSIVGGADQAQFEISGSTLRWSSNGTRNYEAPADANTDNAYVVTVRATDAATNTTDQTITVTVTDVDEIPAAFSFTDQTDVELSTLTESNEITVSGMAGGASAAVSITGGEYSKNGGGYTSSAGTAVNTDTFKVRHTSSGSYSTAVNTVLTIGGVSDTFTTTTEAESLGPEMVTTPDFSSATGWNVAPPVSISTGKLRFAFDVGGAGAQETGGTSAIEEGVTYRLVFTVDSIASGAVYGVISGGTGGNDIGTSRTAPGTYSQDLIAGDPAEGTLNIVCDPGTEAVLDDVSLKEVLA